MSPGAPAHGSLPRELPPGTPAAAAVTLPSANEHWPPQAPRLLEAHAREHCPYVYHSPSPALCSTSIRTTGQANRLSLRQDRMEALPKLRLWSQLPRKGKQSLYEDEIETHKCRRTLNIKSECFFFLQTLPN